MLEIYDVVTILPLNISQKQQNPLAAKLNPSFEFYMHNISANQIFIAHNLYFTAGVNVKNNGTQVFHTLTLQQSLAE